MPDIPHDQPPVAAGAPAQPIAQPSDEEMLAAYEAELNRITSAEMILQTAVSLLNIGGRRLGLASPSSSGSGVPSGDSAAPAAERDLEQVRDAIDAVRALMPIMERRMPSGFAPLRDAVSQLQMAYAREVQGIREPAPAGAAAAGAAQPASAESDAPAPKPAPRAEGEKPAPGPAESSGRLWVPGR